MKLLIFLLVAIRRITPNRPAISPFNPPKRLTRPYWCIAFVAMRDDQTIARDLEGSVDSVHNTAPCVVFFRHQIIYGSSINLTSG